MSAVTGTDRRTLVRRFLAAQDPLDVDTLAVCRHPEFASHWPQTGEVVAGHDADLRVRAGDSPSAGALLLAGPVPVVRSDSSWQLRGRDSLWIGQTVGATGDGEPCHVVTVIELQAGLIRCQTTWIAPSFPRPESRASLSEHAEWHAADDVIEPVVSDEVITARRRAIEAYFSDLSEDPVAAHRAFLHPHVIEVMPQSSERIVGRDRMIEVLLAHPHFPIVEMRRTLVVGDTGLAEVRMREGDENFFGICIIRFSGLKADTITEYWAPARE